MRPPSQLAARAAADLGQYAEPAQLAQGREGRGTRNVEALLDESGI